MIIPPNYPNPATGDRLGGRQIRIGISIDKGPFVDHILGPDADIVFGTGGPGVLAVPGWTGPDLRVISQGRWLTLGPGMRVIMCHETGEDRMEGEYEELVAGGVSFPVHINVSRLNVRVRQGVVMLMEYAPSPASGSGRTP